MECQCRNIFSLALFFFERMIDFMNNIVGRILTGICGSFVMAGFNRWNSLEGWAYGISLVIGFIVFFCAAMAIEYFSNKKNIASKNSVGSHNKAKGNQRIEIVSKNISTTSGSVGSNNKAKGDQKIKIK